MQGARLNSGFDLQRNAKTRPVLAQKLHFLGTLFWPEEKSFLLVYRSLYLQSNKEYCEEKGLEPMVDLILRRN